VALGLYLPSSSLAVSFVSQWGSLGTADGQFQTPTAVDTALDGSVYVGEYDGNRVQQFSSTGAFIRKFGSGGAGDGQFNKIGSLAVRSANGDVYVTDYHGHRVEQFSSTGAFIRKWGAFGVGSSQFNEPVGIDVSNEFVYVADCSNHRIQQFTLDGIFVRRWGKNGGDGTLGTAAGEFNCPYDVEIAPNGDVYATDGNYRVQQFTANGTFIRKWGMYGTGDVEFESPSGVALDGSGNVWTADTINERVQEFSPTGVFITTFGSAGSGPGQFSDPYQLALDCRGNVYVADASNQQVQKFATLGGGEPPCSTPATLAPPPDSTAPKAKLSFARRQKLSKLSISVTLNEAGVVALTGSVNLPGSSKKTGFKRIERTVAVNQAVKVRPRLSKKNRSRVTRALRSEKPLKAKFKLKATDKAGNSSTKKAGVRLK
jgi:streptogramin lyase